MQYTSVITLELHFIMAWAVSTVIQQLLLPKSELNVWGCTTGNLRISICTNLLHSRFNCCVVFRLLQNCLLLPIYSTVHTSISFIQFCQHELGGVYFYIGMVPWWCEIHFDAVWIFENLVHRLLLNYYPSYQFCICFALLAICINNVNASIQFEAQWGNEPYNTHHIHICISKILRSSLNSNLWTLHL